MSLAVPMLAVFALFSVPAQAAKKPDLVIAKGVLQGQHYAFQGEAGGFFAQVSTRNAGTAVAGPSVTRVDLLHGDTRLKLGSRPVSRLLSGKQSSGDTQDSANHYGYPLGQYVVVICADATNQVAESNETNNCIYAKDELLRPVKVYIVKRTWLGTLNGAITLGGVLETYKSQNARLVFDRPSPLGQAGLFEYDFHGPVTYKDSGAGSGCTYSGGDTASFGPANTIDNLVLDYRRGLYAGGAAVDDFTYKITLKCGPITTTQDAPIEMSFLNMDQHSLPFGATRLAGTYSLPSQLWQWDFR